ncbi:TrmB family transcriptional regulator [Metabacillus iocasae]|uniref:Sugar-specific transcriptional regulator TrmB n=1 Tax=Priestia iocasae TaxID=2291674 RepID=A0ABS2QYR3_9BACI|nr:TrmB family transcriptional regulator [Metabacillus iocasae]MBM7703609.1 sugar-specific transcriptional regulator TrmB [Metabacillus iocasae]
MLQKFGFSQYESQVYEALLSSNTPLDTTSIVHSSNVPKAKIYEVLNKMSDKGMVLTTISGKKKLYLAVPLETIIQKLTATFKQDIQELKTFTPRKVTTDDHIWTLKDYQSIISEVETLILDAKQSIILSAWNEELERFLPLLEQKEKEGIDVEVLIIGKLHTSLKNLHSLHPHQDHKKLEPSQLISVDEQIILFAGIENNKWKAIKTESQPFVKFFTDFFYHDVALAHITEKYQEQLLQDDKMKRLLTRLRY